MQCFFVPTTKTLNRLRGCVKVGFLASSSTICGAISKNYLVKDEVIHTSTCAMFSAHTSLSELKTGSDRFLYVSLYPASILYKSRAGRCRPVSYLDGPKTARYRFIKNAYWVLSVGLYKDLLIKICPKKYYKAFISLLSMCGSNEAVTSENVPSDTCAQRRFRSACAFAQSDQNIHWVQFA